MQKIMFNDRYGLTHAVIEGRKTMTRRVIPESVIEDYQSWLDDVLSIGFDDIPVEVQSFAQAAILKAKYSVGEVVAVAQSYESLANSGYLDKMMETSSTFKREYCGAGWSNKMFVRPDLMPIKIRITDVKVERLQDISNEECMKEGIYEDVEKGFNVKRYFDKSFKISFYHTYYGAISKKAGEQLFWTTPREAFADLIDKVSGKGTWNANPWVFAYSFELINKKNSNENTTITIRHSWR